MCFCATYNDRNFETASMTNQSIQLTLMQVESRRMTKMTNYQVLQVHNTISSLQIIHFLQRSTLNFFKLIFQVIGYSSHANIPGPIQRAGIGCDEAEVVWALVRRDLAIAVDTQKQ